MLTIAELGELVHRVRRRQGLSMEETAELLGIEVHEIRQAEGTYHGLMLRVRKRILQQLTGYTLEGPYYQVRRLDE